jgi:hypothetical protein
VVVEEEEEKEEKEEEEARNHRIRGPSSRGLRAKCFFNTIMLLSS